MYAAPARTEATQHGKLRNRGMSPVAKTTGKEGERFAGPAKVFDRS